MTRYASGRRQEYLVKKLLESAGAYLVTRSAGSKGAADLVAFFDHATYAVQVKRAKPTGAEHLKVQEASANTACKWVMVWSNAGVIRQWVYQRGKASKIPVPGLGNGL